LTPHIDNKRIPRFLPHALLALAASACGHARYPLPDHVSITIVDATVAPGNDRGLAWDGAAPVAAQVVSGLAQSVAGLGRGKEGERKAAAIISFIAEAAGRGIAAPDPRGWAEVQVPGGQPARARLAENGDSFRPQWSGVRWIGVPLAQDTRLRVYLEDVDTLGSNDPIGTAEIGYDDLIDALDSQKVWQVAVADQTHNQLLYVGISVTGE
jgi:hypothetical protein